MTTQKGPGSIGDIASIILCPNYIRKVQFSSDYYSPLWRAQNIVQLWCLSGYFWLWDYRCPTFLAQVTVECLHCLVFVFLGVWWLYSVASSSAAPYDDSWQSKNFKDQLPLFWRYFQTTRVWFPLSGNKRTRFALSKWACIEPTLQKQIAMETCFTWLSICNISKKIHIILNCTSKNLLSFRKAISDSSEGFDVPHKRKTVDHLTVRSNGDANGYWRW